MTGCSRNFSERDKQNAPSSLLTGWMGQCECCFCSVKAPRRSGLSAETIAEAQANQAHAEHHERRTGIRNSARADICQHGIIAGDVPAVNARRGGEREPNIRRCLPADTRKEPAVAGPSEADAIRVELSR